MSQHSTKFSDKITGLSSVVVRLSAVLGRKRVAIPISLAITVIAMWVAVKGVDLSHAWTIMKSARVLPLIAVLALMIPGTLMRAWRFHLLMSKSSSSFIVSLEALLVGLFASGVLPMRAGEAVRVAYFAKRTGSPLFSTASALVLERIADALSLALMAGLLLPPALGPKAAQLKIPPSLLTIGSICGVLFLAGVAIWMIRQGDRDPDSYHGMKKRLMEARQGLASLQSGRLAVMIAALSMGNWLITAVPGIFMFKAMGIDITYLDSVVIFLGVCFSVALPSAPGFVGVFHMGFVAGALLVGIPKEAALAAAVITHLFTQVPFILAGGFVLIYRKMGLPGTALKQDGET